MALTEKQEEVIETLKTGPGLVPARVAHKLIGYGLAEKTGESEARGQSHVRLTDAGKAAVL